MDNFEVINDICEIKELEEVKKFLSFAVSKLNIEDAYFNIIIVDNKKIHEINKEYRGIDRETDVISFALEDDKSFINILDFRILGDIYISIDKAREQALSYGHSLLRELSFLAIHGLLHLLGYDHMEENDEKIMFNLQKELLDEYGIKR